MEVIEKGENFFEQKKGENLIKVIKMNMRELIIWKMLLFKQLLRSLKYKFYFINCAYTSPVVNLDELVKFFLKKKYRINKKRHPK